MSCSHHRILTGTSVGASRLGRWICFALVLHGVLVSARASKHSSTPAARRCLALVTQCPLCGQARLLLLAALSGEHILFIGPPGTAKSELGRRLSQLYKGNFFERLLTRFSVPEVSIAVAGQCG